MTPIPDFNVFSWSRTYVILSSPNNNNSTKKYVLILFFFLICKRVQKFCFSLSELYFYSVKLRIYTLCPGVERRPVGHLLKSKKFWNNGGGSLAHRQPSWLHSGLWCFMGGVTGVNNLQNHQHDLFCTLLKDKPGENWCVCSINGHNSNIQLWEILHLGM